MWIANNSYYVTAETVLIVQYVFSPLKGYLMEQSPKYVVNQTLGWFFCFMFFLWDTSYSKTLARGCSLMVPKKLSVKVWEYLKYHLIEETLKS